MKRGEAAFGQRVTAADRLVRHVDASKTHPTRRSADWKGWTYEGQRWSSINKPKPVEGVLVGIRYVHAEGYRVWNGEDGISWEPIGEKRAQALVAVDLQHDPVRVWLDDLVLAGTPDAARISKALSYMESESYYDAKPHKAHRDLEAVRRVLSA